VVPHHHTPPVNSRLRGLFVGAFFLFDALFDAEYNLKQAKKQYDGVKQESKWSW